MGLGISAAKERGLEDHVVAAALIGVATWWAMNTASDSRL
jgi:hypothetical protein